MRGTTRRFFSRKKTGRGGLGRGGASLLRSPFLRSPSARGRRAIFHIHAVSVPLVDAFEYFESARRSLAANAATVPRLSGGFFPYADNFPHWENAWVGSYVARRALKSRVVAAAELALDATSLGAMLADATADARSSFDPVAIEASLRSARRGACLGSTTTLVTGTCPADVADDVFDAANRAEADARSAVARLAAAALECEAFLEEGGRGRRGARKVFVGGFEGGASDPVLAIRAGDVLAARNPSSLVVAPRGVSSARGSERTPRRDRRRARARASAKRSQRESVWTKQSSSSLSRTSPRRASSRSRWFETPTQRI